MTCRYVMGEIIANGVYAPKTRYVRDSESHVLSSVKDHAL